MATQTSSTCLILTVGTGTQGSYSNLAQGLINTICITLPSRFWLVPSISEDSIAIADLIVESLDTNMRNTFVPWSQDAPYLMIDEHDSLEETRTKLAQLIHHIRENHPDSLIIVNPTSGTKQMSAGATVAALEQAADQIEFTTGKRADGVVMTGTETITPFFTARWRAERDASMAADLWNLGFFPASAAAFRSGAKHLTQTDVLHHRLLGLAIAADAFAHKDAFRFSDAEKKFRETRKHLNPDAAELPPSIKEFGSVCLNLASRCQRFSAAQNGKRDVEVQKQLCVELVDNALRASAAGRCEDAACRLYRAMEMNLQIRLAEKTSMTYWNGRLVAGKTPPAALNSSSFLGVIRRGELPSEFSLEQLVRALDELGDPTVRNLCEDLNRNHLSLFRNATAARNASILAHGTTPVSDEGFLELKKMASSFLGMSIRETSPLHPFDLDLLCL